MSSSRNPVADASGIETRADLAGFIGALAAEARSAEAHGWENTDLPRFLEAMAGWVEDMEGYFSNRGVEPPETPSWRLLGEILAAATVYE